MIELWTTLVPILLADAVNPVLLMLIGLALVADALTYFVTGEGLVWFRRARRIRSCLSRGQADRDCVSWLRFDSGCTGQV